MCVQSGCFAKVQLWKVSKWKPDCTRTGVDAKVNFTAIFDHPPHETLQGGLVKAHRTADNRGGATVCDSSKNRTQFSTLQLGLSAHATTLTQAITSPSYLHNLSDRGQQHLLHVGSVQRAGLDVCHAMLKRELPRHFCLQRQDTVQMSPGKPLTQQTWQASDRGRLPQHRAHPSIVYVPLTAAGDRPRSHLCPTSTPLSSSGARAGRAPCSAPA